jgi:cytidine deaminase
MIEQNLVAKAWEARQNAHAPYSNFFVGSAVLTRDGRTIQGSNQETANYKGSCAEKVVLDSAGAAGVKDQVAKIAIAGGPASLNPYEKALIPEEPIAPCGQCRQDIKEVQDLSGNPIVIILASRNKIIRLIGIDNLLPFSFGPSDLGIKLR